MSWSDDEVDNLRLSLRHHPGVLLHIDHLADLHGISCARMSEIAEKLDIDIDLARRSDFYYVPDFSGFDTSNTPGYSWSHPGFKGSIEDSMSLGLDELELDLPIRVDYVWTPEWPYFDLHLARVILLGGHMSTDFRVRAHLEASPVGYLDGRPDGYREAETWWEPINNLFQSCVLGSEAHWTAFEDRIDEACMCENLKRLSDAGLKPEYVPLSQEMLDAIRAANVKPPVYPILRKKK